MQQIDETVLNKLAVKDIMFKRRKLWYKCKTLSYSHCFKPIPVIIDI